MKLESIKSLRDRLKLPLPGFESHKTVMGHRKPFVPNQLNQPSPRKSAVLLHLYYHLGEIYLIYIQRPQYEGVHSRQISFPGGKVENSDVSILHTAIREAREEVNIEESKIEILGGLTELYIPPSNFLVQPFVSFQKERPLFIPDKREVEKILEVPVKELQNQSLQTFVIHQKSQSISVKGYKVKGEVLWGASAMMTKELLDML